MRIRASAFFFSSERDDILHSRYTEWRHCIGHILLVPHTEVDMQTVIRRLQPINRVKRMLSDEPVIGRAHHLPLPIRYPVGLCNALDPVPHICQRQNFRVGQDGLFTLSFAECLLASSTIFFRENADLFVRNLTVEDDACSLVHTVCIRRNQSANQASPTQNWRLW